MKFSKSRMGERSLEVMMAIIKSFMAGGGFEMQINVTDREMLARGIEEPEKRRDLVVRIGVYSDFSQR